MKFAISFSVTHKTRCGNDEMKKRETALNSFQENLGYFFHDRGLLETALCHSSYANENGLPNSNERLEFLGDSVLGMAVAHKLYETYPDASEGELSNYRVEFVCRDALFGWAQSLDLATVLLKGKSLKGVFPPSIFADAMEAVLGAVYLDGQYDAAVRVVQRYLFGANKALASGGERDAKSMLQACLQGDDLELPRYEILSVKGPSHAPLFLIQVRAAGKIWSGEGGNRKEAELKAAAAALKDLGYLKNPDSKTIEREGCDL